MHLDLRTASAIVQTLNSRSVAVKVLALISLLLALRATATPVAGHLSSPTGTLPALRVYAWSASGRLLATATAPGQPAFHFDLPPGRYRLFATPADPGVPLVYAGHTSCVGNEDAGACTNHDLRWVQVAGETPIPVEVGDWHIDDTQAQILDRALHRPDGAGDQDPSNGAPRFFEYPAQPLRRARAQRLAPGDFRPEDRARLSNALKLGHINFAGQATVLQFSCGLGCLTARIVDLETGRVTLIPSGAQGQGAQACPERLAYRRESRLLRVDYEGADGGAAESYYVWDAASAELKPIGLPAHCTTPDGSAGR